MPRRAKPYLHRGWYVTNIGGVRHKLCPEADGLNTAEDAFLALQTERQRTGGRNFPNLRVVELIALFLESVKVEKSEATYLDYQRWLTEFAQKHGMRTARDVTRPDALKFRNELAESTYQPGVITRGAKRGMRKGECRRYSPKTVNHAVIALKRCWNWSVENHYLPLGANPFAKLPLLHVEGRQRIITDAEFQLLLRNNTDAVFRQFLLVLRYTSARPGELRHLTWPQVDFSNNRLVIPRHKTTRTSRRSVPRIIPLPDCIVALLRILQRRHGHQPYCFLNSEQRPWTKNAVVQRMDSLRQRAGIAADENGEGLVLYSNRHTYITTAASTEGLSGPLLQQLAGHTDPRTTERYAHLASRDIVLAGRRAAQALRPRRPGK